MDEGRKLARISRSAKSPVRLRRAIVATWICTIARTSPADWGITAFSTWSLAKLRAHLVGEGIVAELSRETLRRILHAGGVSWQTTTTWKASTDPDFIPKMPRPWTSTTTHPPTAAWSASMSSGR
jgi:hypothetical protein